MLLHGGIAVGTVTISISCVTLLNHLDVYEGDANAIPKGGEILPAVSVELYENDTAYTLLKRVCREKNIEVQKVTGIVVEDIIVPYEGHLAENAYSYLTSVLSQYTTYLSRPPLA